MRKCKNRIVDGIVVRPCSKCGRELPLDQFHQFREIRHGGVFKIRYPSSCRNCKSRDHAARYGRPPAGMSKGADGLALPPLSMPEARALARSLDPDEEYDIEEMAREICNLRMVFARRGDAVGPRKGRKE